MVLTSLNTLARPRPRVHWVCARSRGGQPSQTTRPPHCFVRVVWLGCWWQAGWVVDAEAGAGPRLLLVGGSGEQNGWVRSLGGGL